MAIKHRWALRRAGVAQSDIGRGGWGGLEPPAAVAGLAGLGAVAGGGWLCVVRALRVGRSGASMEKWRQHPYPP